MTCSTSLIGLAASQSIGRPESKAAPTANEVTAGGEDSAGRLGLTRQHFCFTAAATGDANLEHM